MARARSQFDSRSLRMNLLAQFRTVDAWRMALGLLPVFLHGSAENQERYVLLNGARGNFCLDFVGGMDQHSQRIAAWSCDVGHYLTVGDGFVTLNRWEKGAFEERFSSRSVFERISEFHRHLEKASPDQSRNIVNHILAVFRRIRTIVGEEDNGLRSLRVLLHLLASAAAENENPLTSDLAQWGLTAEVVESSQPISAATWHPLYSDLCGIGRYDALPPDFDLVIRHASGAVFQTPILRLKFLDSSGWKGWKDPPLLILVQCRTRQVFTSPRRPLLAPWLKKRYAKFSPLPMRRSLYLTLRAVLGSY